MQWHGRGTAASRFCRDFFLQASHVYGNLSSGYPTLALTCPIQSFPPSITARQMPHAGGLQLLYGFTKQGRKQKSMNSLLFFLLISFGDFNKAHLCDKHTYFNMPLTININQKRAKTSGYPEAAGHRITSKEGTLPQETALCL